MCHRLALFVVAAGLCSAQTYQDPNAPLDARVNDLISRMTLEEKVSQLTNDSPAIERLGVSSYNWWNECLHGVARAGRATVFPEAIGLAATWDTDLMFRVATAISDEARAKYHEFQRRGKHNIYQGLTFWTPNINLFRDPRWGRGMETYGEDPYLTARMAVQFIKGLQGDDPKYLKTIATAKHYAVHSGPESLRHTFDAAIDDTDLLETYLPHFEAAVKEGGAYSVMCAYNRVDGQPACANPRLLGGILRERWGFQGYVVSDCGAIGDIWLNHKFAPNAQEGVARAIKAGTDLNCGVEYAAVLRAVRADLLAESEIDLALRRLFTARFKLGMFDPPSMVKYAQIPYSVNESPAHRQLALETARKSIVLLKNEAHTLPLSKSLKTVAVIGPDADDAEILLGNYNGDPTEPVTPLAGIRKKLGASRVLYARGSDLAANLPAFDTIPSSALFTSNGSDRRNGLTGEYFATGNFDGKRHRPRELTYPSSGQMVGDVPANPKPLFTRVDEQVAFRWWDGAPRPDMDDDNFGARWTGYVCAPADGQYHIGVIGMNAFELYFDGKLVAQTNNIHERTYQYARVEMQAGKLYPIRLDFHEYSGDADIRLVWAYAHPNLQAEALAAARQADAVVLVLGLSPRLEGEEMRVPVEGFSGGDRVDLGIPRVQQELMEKVVATGKPVVLVLLNGSALAVNWARDHAPAIIEDWYPGQAGGDALADVLFGDYNPAGRLPVTFYQSADQLPAFSDYSMKGRTYRFFKGEPLFAFGHGLSYTAFAYQNLRVNNASHIVSAEVRNTGRMAGEEVVQFYIKSDGPQLTGFRRVSLKPGERKTVQFTFPQVKPGTYQVFVGGGQPGRTNAIVSSTLTL
jgi:beta-glucosidase